MDGILKKFYEKGYKSPNKLFYKIKEKGYDIRKKRATILEKLMQKNMWIHEK